MTRLLQTLIPILLLTLLSAATAPGCRAASPRPYPDALAAIDSLRLAEADTTRGRAEKAEGAAHSTREAASKAEGSSQVKPADADQAEHPLKQRIGLIKKFFRQFNDFDTLYITPNYYDFTAMLQNTNYFQSYRLEGRDEAGHRQTLTTRPRPSVKVGPYFGYSPIFLGYTFDVAHPRSLGKSSEWNLSLYSMLLGCDFVYVKNDGNFELRRATGFDGVVPKSVKGTRLSGMSSSTLSFSAYYIFNHRRFSYPATFNQSTVQRISCGSPMLGAGYSRQRISFDYHDLPASLLGPDESRLIDELKFSRVRYDYYYLSGGYAYNWVFARNCVVGASLMPTIGIRKAKGQRLQGNEVLLDLKNFSFDNISRVGIVWCNTRWFAGASFVSHLYIYRKDRLSLTNSVNYGNLYFGLFFKRKKAYRNR